MLAFSARTLKDRLQVFERELNALKQGRDSGTIHDFRVAARRLRTALSVFRFAFLEGSPKRWRSHIRGLSRAWGPVRDLDVEMGFLNALLKQSETSGVKEGLIQAMGQLELRRKTRHKRALKALKHFKNGPTIVELNTALRAVSLRPNSPDRERIFKRARKKLKKCRQEIIVYERDVNHPKRYLQLHALRIAVKRLRYTAEVFSPLYEKSLDETISVCRKMQNALGTMHDFYVWQQTLPGPATTGSRSLKKVFKEERRQAYEKFRKQWDKVQKRGVWEDMLKAVGP